MLSYHFRLLCSVILNLADQLYCKCRPQIGPPPGLGIKRTPAADADYSSGYPGQLRLFCFTDMSALVRHSKPCSYFDAL